MLSYNHGYHAGNYADVLKHICLLQAYKSLKMHHKSISYIDTHSGNGTYKFNSEYMSKNKEYENGISKLENYNDKNISIKYYLKVLRNINNSKKLLFYPGSPLIMSNVTDNLDRLVFYEFDENEFKLLRQNLSKKINSKFYNNDGYDFTKQIINKNDKILVLIDPPYESQNDFERVVSTLRLINNEYYNLTVLIWYPILNIQNNDLFIENIRKIGSNLITRIELPITKYNDEIGMKGNGMILFNGSDFLVQNIKECLKELYKIFKNEDCNIKPKIQKI